MATSGTSTDNADHGSEPRAPTEIPLSKLRPDDHERSTVLVGGAVAAATLTAVLAVAQGAVIPAVTALVAVGLLVAQVRRSGRVSLTDDELDRLRVAELALSRATDTREAAEELADHAIALLGARSAVVLIEGIGDTVRVAAGPTRTEDVYGSGSRMRLLDDAGVPCGSIAVSARADGRPYTARHERILDALAERVSTTLHQLSLLTEVQSERQKLADLIGSSSDGIFSVGSDLRVRSWNPAMERISGATAKEAVGRHVADSFRPVGADGTARHGAGDPGRSGVLVEAVLLRVDTDGEPRWLTCSYAPLTDGGYVVIARDDTERKKLQDDKDGWIAQVSHELRTPLTPIKGFLHTLARRDAELVTSDRQRIYEIMIREEQRLEDLVNALLRSTQLDNGTFSAVPAPVDWRDLVAESVLGARRHDPSRVIDLEVGDDIGTVTTDASIATAVLANLLSNAVKYGGSDTPVQVEVQRSGDEVITSVVDHGPGIARSDRERIFDKFTRLGDHLTRPQQGVGLGLYIARRSVGELGGRIWVEATPGGGATFRFSLPAVPATPPARAAEPAAPARDGEAADRRRSRQLRAATRPTAS